MMDKYDKWDKWWNSSTSVGVDRIFVDIPWVSFEGCQGEHERNQKSNHRESQQNMIIRTTVSTSLTWHVLELPAADMIDSKGC